MSLPLEDDPGSSDGKLFLVGLLGYERNIMMNIMATNNRICNNQFIHVRSESFTVSSLKGLMHLLRIQ